MDATFNKELFMELANLIKDDMAIYVNTRSEMARFTREHPEQYQLLLKKAQVGLELSINDSSFELLSDKKMESLQGTGNRLESKTVVCMIVGLKIDW